MTRQVGIVDYIGTSGGFTVKTGRYIGTAAGTVTVAGSGHMTLLSQNDDIDIVASGHIRATSLDKEITLTANNPTAGSVSINGAVATTINGGSVVINANPSDVTIDAIENIFIFANKEASLDAAAGQLSIAARATGQQTMIRGPGSNSNGTGGGVVISTSDASLGMGSISGLAGRQLHLHSSGFMNLRANNGGLTILASGQLNIGNQVNPLALVFNNQGTPYVGNDARYAALNISGQLNVPTTNVGRGDIWSVIHNLGSGALPADVTTPAIVVARSLGPASLCFDTGSGIANVSFGSGIVQVTNLVQQSIATRTPTEIDWSLTGVGSGISDLYFAVGSNNVTVLVPGMYRLSYKCNVTINGTAQSTFKFEAYKTRPGGTAEPLVHTKSYVPTNGTNAVKNTGSNGWGTLINCSQGDIIDLRGSYDTGFTGNTVNLPIGESFMILQYIGPAR